MGKRKIEIMDTTLRDGEQTSGVSFSAAEKLTIAQLLLEELNVDRIEIASARVSEGEFEGVKGIMAWAKEKGYTNKIEVLTFVDGGLSIDWMKKSGAKVQNLLTKGSLNHLTHQLKKTPEQHFNEIAQAIALAQENNIETNVYLEDWSNGMKKYYENSLELIVSRANALTNFLLKWGFSETKINEVVAISYFQGIRYTINNLLNSEDYNSERLRKILKLPKLV